MSEATLQKVHSFKELLIYLEEKLDWPLQGYSLEEAVFSYEPNELGIKDNDVAKIKVIHQLRPLTDGQPWGVFFIEFENKKLPIVILRRILSHLIIKKRTSTNKSSSPAWHSGDLLFITSFGSKTANTSEIAFAHFRHEKGELPTLNVLGWDGDDTVLKIASVERTLSEYLKWPEDCNDLESWRNKWRKPFKHSPGFVIRTSDLLANELASLARKIRQTTKNLLEAETDNGILTKLFKSFQQALIHDLSKEDFADTYAQTITYGLLTAAISKNENNRRLNVDSLAEMIPSTNPFLKEMLGEFLKIGGEKTNINFDELGIQNVVDLLSSEETDLPAILLDFGKKTQGEDPVIHFYEHFLDAYDKKLKFQKGVFYTPQPVVKFIVRSIHDLLINKLNIEDGLASTISWDEYIKNNQKINLPHNVAGTDYFVQILDPATGTSTFLIEVIEIIHKTMISKWKKENIPDNLHNKKWNEYVPKYLLSRMYAYELMMAPYAIAHMKIGLKLKETGYLFESNERANIYLSNSLDPYKEQLPLIGFDALAKEAQAVNNLKRAKHFTVLIGNPPYAGVSSNMSHSAQELVKKYKFIDGKELKEKKLWLQDDYVKFISYSQNFIDKSGVGILGMITNHGFLNNPTFRGMRQNLMTSFQSINIIDLHGNSTRREFPPENIKDKNVFDIQQGVSIIIGIKKDEINAVQHIDLWGSREFKYSWLNKELFLNIKFTNLNPDSPYYFFEEQNNINRDEYDKFTKLNEIMPISSGGFITSRDHFVIDFEKNKLINRINDFADIKYSDEEIRKKYFLGCGSDKYPDGDTRGWKVSEARKIVYKDANKTKNIQICTYRPFDQRLIYWSKDMIDWPRPEVMGHMLDSSNIALQVCRQSVSDYWAHAFICKGLIDFCAISNKTREGGYVFPLFISNQQSPLDFKENPRINFDNTFIVNLTSLFEMKEDSVSGEDVFFYIYAILYSRNYRLRYENFLKIDFPKIPISKDKDLFYILSSLGKKLSSFHLLASSKLENNSYEFKSNAVAVIDKISWSDNVVWINKSKNAGFYFIPESLWNFKIGGYQVCEKWLKDRIGNYISEDLIKQYIKILNAISETIELMNDIDLKINDFGGWPKAFI